jgi:hypothetical protein
MNPHWDTRRLVELDVLPEPFISGLQALIRLVDVHAHPSRTVVIDAARFVYLKRPTVERFQTRARQPQIIRISTPPSDRPSSLAAQESLRPVEPLPKSP